ncbi:MAG: argininosuccinate synthase [Candidatus Parcubacteria bacterium]|nr:argininosuccinate synthase [Candidatus Parcubacteria bacterium]
MTVADLKGQTVGMAVSGGLDSCTVTKWLTEHDVNVVCLTADLGQPDEKNINDVKKRMLACGAKEAIIVDAKKQLVFAGLYAALAQLKYEGGYWNTTGIGRFITVTALLEELAEREIEVFCHGATGRGNDQVRFQLVSNMLMPEIKVYAPWRDEAFLDAFGGRKEMIAYCQKHNLPIKATLEKPYSTDANMLGLTHEAGKLELLTTPADFVEPEMGVWAEQAPNNPEIVTIEFIEGLLRSIKVRSGVEGIGNLVILFDLANEVAGRNGVGIGIHTVENRFVGIKSRGVYEAPGMELFGKCYEYLLQTILDRRAMKLFQYLSLQLGEQIYQGYWYDTASQMMRAAINKIAKFMTGTITVKLYKGNVIFQSAENIPHSLYSESTASMEKIGSFNHQDSEGFLGVLGVGARALNAAGQIDPEEFLLD